MTVAACPACVGLPVEDTVAASEPMLQFSLPTIHCAACIATIERGLQKVRGVRSARVNLSMKRLGVEGGADPDEIVAAVSKLGYEIYPLDQAALEQAKDKVGGDLLMRLAVAGFAMMNVMLLSVAVWSGAEGATRDLFHLISACIAVPVVAYSGQPFFRSALQALSVRRLNMDVPISLAILLATVMSVFESLAGGHHAYFDAALSLTFFLLIGRYLDHRSRSAARSAAKELAALEVHTCQRLRGDTVETVRTDEVAIGDRILISAGSRVPIDGTLLSEAATLDRSFLTGESLAVTVEQDTTLQAGEINLGSPVEMVATAVGKDTTLRRVAALVETAENGRNAYTALADRAAQIYAPAVHLLALVAFLGWWIIDGNLRQAANIAIAVLIITCPCALGLAVPAVTTTAISRLFKAGFLVKHATALERLAEVDHIVFDKTGTLSTATIDIPASLSCEERALALALAQMSNHPLSRALTNALSEERPVQLSAIEEITGHGVSALWNGTNVALGRGAWLGADFDELGLLIGEKAPVMFSVVENLRPGVTESLAQIDLTAEIVTGDAPAPAKTLARKAGLPITARVTPENKCARLAQLSDQGKRVLMVGDGLNDTLALASAHAALAPAKALDASRTAADVVLLKHSFENLPLLLKTARAARRISKQNFGIAAVYNMIAIPIALAGFATPLAAAIAMSLSSITVILNAQRVGTTS